jgi:enterochelin esterase-like enzyme
MHGLRRECTCGAARVPKIPWMSHISSRRLVPALCLAVTLAACASGKPTPSLSGGAGASGSAGATGTAGSSETAGAGTSGGGGAETTGAAGVTAGSTGAAGTTTDAGATDATTTGAAGTDGAAEATSGLTTGRQDDPGTTGDGTVPLPGPYADTTTSTMHLNGAPTGQLLGPMTYTLQGSYTGWQTGLMYSYWIYVPAQYKPLHRAALMVFQDGLHYIGDPKQSQAQFNTPTVLDNLIAAGTIPVTIALFVNPGEKGTNFPYTGSEGPVRSKQYDTPNDQYGKFLIQEFLPAVLTSKYDIVTDPDGWAIGGHSSGGIAAFSASWFWPDNFHKVITASPSFSNTGGVFPAMITKTTPGKPMRIYHMAGTNDLCCPSWYDENNMAAMDLMMMGYHYRYRPGTGMHFPPAEAAQDFPDALTWLWRGYHTPP